MSKAKPFLDSVLAGEILDPDEEIEDAIEGWHSVQSAQGELHEYLGMTWEEYALFVEQPDALSAIVAARRSGVLVEPIATAEPSEPLLDADVLPRSEHSPGKTSRKN